MKYIQNQHVYKWLVTGLVGGILAAFYLFLLNHDAPINKAAAFFIFLYLWTLFSLVVYFLWFRIINPRLSFYTKRWKAFWLSGCLLTGIWLSINIPVVYPQPANGSFASSGIFKLLFTGCAGIGIGLALFTLSAFFNPEEAFPAKTREQRPFRWLLFALPMLTAWIIFLLAFWPGLMSNDSLDQWGQVLTGRFNDHHPAFHTFTIWLLTRITLSPAVVALAQIIALGLVAGCILAYLESLGAPSLWVWAASFLFAISPVNGTMVNTLWKDIPYSTALLGLTFLIFRLAQSRGKWIAERYNWVILGVTAALMILFRHNGLPVVLGLFPLLILGFFHQWKRLAYAFALCMGLYFVITGPVYQLAQVQKSDNLLAASTSLYSVAAHADPGTNSDAVLWKMETAPSSWQCTILSELDQASKAESQFHQNNTGQQAVNLVRFSPALLLYDYRCNRSLIWIIWDPHGEVRNPSHAEYLIDANPYGLTPDTKIPVLRSAMMDFVTKTSRDTNINWFVWRPALSLYLFLVVIAIGSLRHRDPRLLFAAVPILLQSIASTAIISPPNFRYYYSAYLIGLLFWPVLFTKPDCSMDQQTVVDGTEADRPEIIA